MVLKIYVEVMRMKLLGKSMYAKRKWELIEYLEKRN